MNTENTTAEWVEENKQQLFRETAQAQHSPLPWSVLRLGGKPPKIVNAGKPGFIATLGFPNEGNREANATFIVRACNNAQRLADALRKITEREWSGEEKTWRTEAIEIQDEARAALAQWEGGKQ